MTDKGLRPLLIKFFEAFKNSPEGKILKNRIRYKKYKPINTSNEKWQNILGIDINTIFHNLTIYHIAQEFTEEPEISLSEEEKDLLFLSAIIHNWGEARGPEIPCDLKTKEEEKKEIERLKEITNQIAIEIFPEKKLYKKCLQVINEIITNKKTKLGRMFWAIEYFAYLETALSAWDQSLKNPKIKENLQWIVVNTWCENFTQLMEFSKEYPLIKKTLKENINTIDNSFRMIPISVFDLFEETYIIETKLRKFNKARNCWQKNKEDL